MFKVNKLTDYATVVLIDMARNRKVHPTQAISDSTGIPLPTVAKLMKHLVKSGLVMSHRGVHGGYRLTRPASETTIADVIEAVEGPIALTACVETSDEHCGYESLCAASGKWNRVNRAVTNALKEVTLAEMIDDLSGSSPFAVIADGAESPSASAKQDEVH